MIFGLILVDYGEKLPIMVKYGRSKVLLVHFSCFFVHLSVFLVKFWSIICQFLSNFGHFFSKFFVKMILSSQFFTQLLLEVKCEGNYLLNYYWKSNSKAIIFSIIT